jgi:hypothetical protein
MSKPEVIAQELDRLPEQELDRFPAFLRSLGEAYAETAGQRWRPKSALA